MPEMNLVGQIALIASTEQSTGTANGTAKPTFDSSTADTAFNRFKGPSKRGRLILMVSASAAGRSARGILQGRVPGTDGTETYHWYTITQTDLVSDGTGNATTLITDHIPPFVRGQVVTAGGAVTSKLDLEISN